MQNNLPNTNASTNQANLTDIVKVLVEQQLKEQSNAQKAGFEKQLNDQLQAQKADFEEQLKQLGIRIDKELKERRQWLGHLNSEEQRLNNHMANEIWTVSFPYFYF